MARGEDEGEHVVVDVLQRGREVGLSLVGDPQLLGTTDVLELLGQVDVPANAVDRTTAGRRGQPRTRLLGDAHAGPLLQRLDEGVLRQVLGEADVAHEAGDHSRHLGGLDPPHRLDGAADVVRAFHVMGR
jgi:hypothetical protein